jgi:uncharacterized caspase-like protein
MAKNIVLNLLAVIWLGVILGTPAHAQMGMRPFAAGIPGLAQSKSISLQRHQARTLLYREALEILKKNPAAADVPVCNADSAANGEVCIRDTRIATPPIAAGDTPAGSPTEPASKKIALLFGNNRYAHPIPELETPINDVQKIGHVLSQQYGFEVRVLTDAKKAEMVQALNQLGEEAQPADSVLIFFAGHGYLMDSNQMGYWIAIDGSVKTPDNWISNTDITKFLKNIAANQVILISDSCFSGSLAREQKVTDSLRAKNLDQARILRSVLVMTSGDEEPVSDEGNDGHSIFAWGFLRSLQSNRGTTPGINVFQTVKKEVIKDFTQQPQYGAVVSAGHSAGGEFFFVTN